MAKWAAASVLDGGSDLLRTLAGTAGRVKMHAIKAYASGDSYATVIGNSCASVDLASADFVQSGAAGQPRVTTVGAKSLPITALSGLSPDSHIAIVDSVASAVLIVTKDAANSVLLTINILSVPAWTWSIPQPT